MPHLDRALANPATALEAICVHRYADIIFRPMDDAAHLDRIRGQRPVLYLAEDASDEDLCRALIEARLALIVGSGAARTAERVGRLRLVS